MTIAATIGGADSMLAQYCSSALLFGGSRDGKRTIGGSAHPGDDPGAAGGDAGADGDQPLARVLGRPAGRADLRHARCALAGALQRIEQLRAPGMPTAAEPTRPAPTCSSSTRCGRACRQSVLDPPQDRGADPPPAGAGAATGGTRQRARRAATCATAACRKPAADAAPGHEFELLATGSGRCLPPSRPCSGATWPWAGRRSCPAGLDQSAKPRTRKSSLSACASRNLAKRFLMRGSWNSSVMGVLRVCLITDEGSK